MNLAAWAERSGVARVTAYRWFRAGRLSVSAHRVGRLILVDEPAGDVGCARLYGKRAAANRAMRALAAAAEETTERGAA